MSAHKNKSRFELWTNKNCILNIGLFLRADMTKVLRYKSSSGDNLVTSLTFFSLIYVQTCDILYLLTAKY